MIARALPGRPRKDGRPPTTRRQVIEAASRLFLSKGYCATSIKAIAQALGSHPSSIFHHFATKQDILAAIVDILFRPYELFAQSLSEASPPADVFLFKMIYEDVLACSQDVTPLLRVFLLPELRHPEFPYVHRYWTLLASIYEREVMRGQADGLFVSCDPRLAAEALFVMGMTPIASFSFPATESKSATADAIARIALRGLLADGSRLDDVAAASHAFPDTLTLGHTQPAA